MLAGVSHDMQTPLSVITSSLELLADPDNDLDGPALADLSRRARRRAGQLDRLVRQFLDWSRLAARVPIVPLLEPVELLPLVADVVADYPAGPPGGHTGSDHGQLRPAAHRADPPQPALERSARCP